MMSYNKLLDLSGNAIAMVLRSDGVFVLTDPSATDADAVQYQSWLSSGNTLGPAASRPARVTSQDLMAQFTSSDASAIQAAVAGNVQFWLLWSSMQAQKDPMLITNARFLSGWNALVTVLGQARMNAIATSLGAPSLVV
jgi:hypothetical protein